MFEQTPAQSSNRKTIPSTFGRLYADALPMGGMTGTWVRVAEADALLDEIERLRAMLKRYGRHTHPNCHDLTLQANGSFGPRNGCLCGLDAALSGDSSAPETPSSLALPDPEHEQAMRRKYESRSEDFSDPEKPTPSKEQGHVPWDVDDVLRFPGEAARIMHEQRTQLIELRAQLAKGFATETEAQRDRDMLQACLSAMRVSRQNGGHTDWSEFIRSLELHLGLPEETKREPRPVDCGNPVMVNAEWYGPCTLPSGHEGDCKRVKAPLNAFGEVPGKTDLSHLDAGLPPEKASTEDCRHIHQGFYEREDGSFGMKCDDCGVVVSSV